MTEALRGCYSQEVIFHTDGLYEEGGKIWTMSFDKGKLTTFVGTRRILTISSPLYFINKQRGGHWKKFEKYIWFDGLVDSMKYIVDWEKYICVFVWNITFILCSQKMIQKNHIYWWFNETSGKLHSIYCWFGEEYLCFFMKYKLNYMLYLNNSKNISYMIQWNILMIQWTKWLIPFGWVQYHVELINIM